MYKGGRDLASVQSCEVLTLWVTGSSLNNALPLSPDPEYTQLCSSYVRRKSIFQAQISINKIWILRFPSLSAVGHVHNLLLGDYFLYCFAFCVAILQSFLSASQNLIFSFPLHLSSSLCFLADLNILHDLAVSCLYTSSCLYLLSVC